MTVRLLDVRRASMGIGALAGLALGVACAPEEEAAWSDEAPTEVATSAEGIANGTPHSPYATSYMTWTRNVVRVGGCTGTLLDREWVLTAAHCISPTADPSTVTVRHDGPSGTQTTQAVELLRHPQTSAGVDVELVRLADPIDTGVAPPSLYPGDTDDLLGTQVYCAGYGAIAVGASCTTGSQCNAGWFCQYGNCLQSNDGTLRTGWMTVIEDPADGDIWYRFDVPNSSGQILLPGDSGSTCWTPYGITGVHKAGNNQNYNRQTSVEAWRSWVLSKVQPTVVSQSNRPGALCKPVGGGELARTSDGQAQNAQPFTQEVICPIKRRVHSPSSNVFAAPAVFVIDRHPTEDVCCYVQTHNPSGNVIASTPQCSSGSSGSYQILDVPTVYEPATWSSAQLRCTLPPSTAAGASSVHTYRSKEMRR